MLEIEDCDFILCNAKSLEAQSIAADHHDRAVPAGLVFMDPPYGKGLVGPALQALHEGDWLAEGVVIVAEVEKRFADVVGAPFIVEDERVYGDSKILFLRYSRST